MRRARVATLLAMAWAGLMAGHRLTYMVLPAADEMFTDGHGYLGPAGVTAGALAVMAGAFCLTVGSMRKRHLQLPAMRLLAAVCTIQVTGFGLQEVLERVVVGAPLTGLATVFLLGIPVQILAAAVATLLAVGLYAAGGALARLLAPPDPAPPAHARKLFPVRLNAGGASVSGGRWTRGPPLSQAH